MTLRLRLRRRGSWISPWEQEVTRELWRRAADTAVELEDVERLLIEHAAPVEAAAPRKRGHSIPLGLGALGRRLRRRRR